MLSVRSIPAGVLVAAAGVVVLSSTLGAPSLVLLLGLGVSCWRVGAPASSRRLSLALVVAPSRRTGCSVGVVSSRARRLSPAAVSTSAASITGAVPVAAVVVVVVVVVAAAISSVRTAVITTLSFVRSSLFVVGALTSHVTFLVALVTLATPVITATCSTIGIVGTLPRHVAFLAALEACSIAATTTATAVVASVSIRTFTSEVTCFVALEALT